MATGGSSSPTPRKLPGEATALLLFCLLQGVVLFIWGYRHDFMTYRQDIGETDVAYRQSENLRQTFPAHGMLHVKTSESGKTKVYTHNVNLGTYYFFLWRSLGVDSRTALTVTVLPVYLGSLLVAYLAVRVITGSRLTAWVFLGLLALDFANVGAFAFNALRAWHYVGLFGALYGVNAIVSCAPGAKPFRALAATALGAIVSFGCGYDFFVIVGACAVAYLLLASDWRRIPAAMSWLILCFLVPFILRQLEVIYWMGAGTWFTDFYMTFAIKVPFASRFISIPSISEIDALYEEAGLIRPPAYPTSDLAGIWNTAEPLARLALFPRYGVLGCVAAAACALAGLAGSFFARKTELFRRVSLAAAYLIGAVIGLFIFAPFSLHVYLKHNFPLVAGLVHLAEAVCLVLAFQLARKSLAQGARLAPTLLFGTCLLLAGNAIAVQVVNAYASKELDFRWIQRLDDLAGTQVLRPETLVAAVMMPPQLNGMLGSKAHVNTVTPDQAPWILARASHLLVERPLIDVPDAGLPATALLYAPGDGWCNLDAREPDLRHRDWLLSLWQRLRNPEPVADRIARVKPVLVDKPGRKTHPDDIVHMEFRAAVPVDVPAPRGVPELEVQTADGRSFTLHNIIDDIPHRIPTGAVSLIYNAKFSMLHVYARLPPEVFVPGTAATELTFRGVLHFGATTIRSDPVVINFSSTASRNRISPILPEPTTDQLCSAFRHYKIIERSRTGVGYAILDLTSVAR